MADTKMRLVDWLDDLCVRFIINLPQEELESVERICFQVEEAQWFYEDFIRPLDPQLPSMNLKKFCLLIFQHCPLLSTFSEFHHTQAYSEFLAYKTRVPVRGAIMLNDTMDHAVLVKGWKKGAKWSFPRGKINKDEKDLDCAIREVYEETGFDIKEAGLVKDEADIKYIEVSMREQHMRLYVFRGVPMDTYFEPRTRKEISKISWYKLSELPTLKRKGQYPQQVQQQGNGEDVLKDNMFYMVAPFLQPLKSWINKQRKQDKMNVDKLVRLAPPVEADLEETTEAEESAAHMEDLTADEAPQASNGQPEDGNLSQLLANLGRGHRASDNLPEVSAPPQTVFDPAEDLKRLLRVGLVPPQQPVISLPEEMESNPLLVILSGNGPPSGPPLPQTPFEQISESTHQPPPPHHQHPRPPHFSQMPPPQFPLSPPHMQPPRSQSGAFPLGPNGQQGPFGQHGIFPPGFRPPPVPPNMSHPMLNSHGPNIQPSFTQDMPRPYQRTGDPQFAQPPQFPGLHGPSIPPASKLPPPKLTAHSLSLLNAFKSPTISKTTPQMQQPSEVHGTTSTKPRAAPPPDPEPAPIRHIVDSPVLQSPKTVFGAESSAPPPAAPKPPRNPHQDSLLNLFRSGSISAAPRPPATPTNLEPIELAAHPTPGHPKDPARRMSKPMIPSSLPHLNIRPHDHRKPSLTSATVSGPLNAPDFETLKHIKDANGHPHGSASASPQPPHTQQEMKTTGPPISILTRPPRSNASPATASPNPRSSVPVSPKTNIIAPKPTGFHPKILRRPQPTPSPIANSPAPPPAFAEPTAPTPNPPSTSSSHTVVPSQAQGQGVPAFDRRESLPQDQKSALLSLFSKPATSSAPTVRPATPHAPHAPGILGAVTMSGIISPVSPASGLQGSPAGRSRISSIGEQVSAGTAAGVPAGVENVFGKAVGDVGMGGAGLGGAALGGTGTVVGGVGQPPQKKASVDNKAFLLGFLEDVARGKR